MRPNLVVIGSQKCGTSALHYYLGLHPEVAMSQPKELNFFIKERNWGRGHTWYESHFDASARVRGESSPNYTNYPRFKGVPFRMHRILPDARLIYLVRDPIDRIVSAYMHNRAKGRDVGDFGETVLNPRKSYLRRSRYNRQLTRFLEFYPRSQLLVLDQADLLDDRRETLAEVFRFLGVDDSFWSEDYLQLRHQTAARRGLAARVGERVPSDLARYVPDRVAVAAPTEAPSVTDELREELRVRLARDVGRFRELTGRDFAHWSL